MQVVNDICHEGTVLMDRPPVPAYLTLCRGRLRPDAGPFAAGSSAASGANGRVARTGHSDRGYSDRPCFMSRQSAASSRPRFSA